MNSKAVTIWLNPRNRLNAAIALPPFSGCASIDRLVDEPLNLSD